MKILSEYLAQHLKDNLFNGGRFRDAETFDAALGRTLHEGIFTFRKELASLFMGRARQCGKNTANDIFNALLIAEDKHLMDLYKSGKIAIIQPKSSSQLKK